MAGSVIAAAVTAAAVSNNTAALTAIRGTACKESNESHRKTFVIRGRNQARRVESNVKV